MYQATAIYQNGEMAYGEGESLAYALSECLSDIDSMCLFLIPDMHIRIIGDSRVPQTMSIDVARNMVQRSIFAL